MPQIKIRGMNITIHIKKHLLLILGCIGVVAVNVAIADTCYESVLAPCQASYTFDETLTCLLSVSSDESYDSFANICGENKEGRETYGGSGSMGCTYDCISGDRETNAEATIEGDICTGLFCGD